uniref:GATOR2 complex protein WDR24 n=2 Tax=Meloidogyne incognita TaxID=6306 RepID=A0A914MKG4_MELIC
MRNKRHMIIHQTTEPLDALCTNKDRSRIAITGRTVVKVFSSCDGKFELIAERNKPRKTMYFSGSIAWCPLRENLIAVTSSVGAIYLWDPETTHMECSYKAHKQLVTKVCFSEFNENILVSGSKDSTVWLYDLRCAEPSLCFASNQDDSIRDIQFCMESKLQDTFVTAGDSGTIRFWDARRPDKPSKEFIAHSSQIYSIALNPQIQSKNLIATAGRDKYIRIWDWSKNMPQFLYTVEMMAIVTRVSWCPDNSWHVACCFAPPSGFVSSDNTIYVWDIRRPFIPFASFDAHTKTCTDMSWPRYGTGGTFLSCGKDGKLIINFTNAPLRPFIYANNVALDTNTSSTDEFIVAVPSSRRKGSPLLMDHFDSFRRRSPSMIFSISPSDPLLMPVKALSYFASNYKITGDSISELCDYNGRVAEYIYRDSLAYTWRVTGLLALQGDIGTTLSHYTNRHAHLVSSFGQNGSFERLPVDHFTPNSNKAFFEHNTKKEQPKQAMECLSNFRESEASMLPIPGSLPSHNELNTNDLVFGDLNFGSVTDDEESHSINWKSIATSTFINCSQLNEEVFDMGKIKYNDDQLLSFSDYWPHHRHFHRSSTRKSRLPSRIAEDLELALSSMNLIEKEEINNRRLFEKTKEEDEEKDDDGLTLSNSSDNDIGQSASVEGDRDFIENVKDISTKTAVSDSEGADSQFQIELETSFSCLSQCTHKQCSIFQFDILPSLKSLLEFFSDLGDVQMCATICMVFGQKIVDYKLVTPSQVDIWFLAYIEILERLSLWRVSAFFVKKCYRARINQLSNESTFVKIWCPHCRSTSTRASMRCLKCRHFYNYTCTICETNVRGIWSSCAECGHGGHLLHMEEWFSQSEFCPVVGCGHVCTKTIKERNK